MPFSFDGSNYIYLGPWDKTIGAINSKNFSVSMWIKPELTDNKLTNMPIMSNGPGDYAYETGGPFINIHGNAGLSRPVVTR